MTSSPFIDPSGILGFLPLASPERVVLLDGKEELFERADRVRFETGGVWPCMANNPAGIKLGAASVTVTEQHPAELASQLPLLRVQVSENCSEAIHTVEPDSGQVLHGFLITTESGGLSPATLLELTDRRRITAGAVSTILGDAPQLIVPIPPE